MSLLNIHANTQTRLAEGIAVKKSFYALNFFLLQCGPYVLHSLLHILYIWITFFSILTIITLVWSFGKWKSKKGMSFLELAHLDNIKSKCTGSQILHFYFYP